MAEGGGWGTGADRGWVSKTLCNDLRGGCKNLHRCTNNFSQDIIKVSSDEQPKLFVLKTKCLLTILICNNNFKLNLLTSLRFSSDSSSTESSFSSDSSFSLSSLSLITVFPTPSSLLPILESPSHALGCKKQIRLIAFLYNI